MSRKNFFTFQSMTALDMSTNQTSAPTVISYLDNVGLEFNWTGNATGAFYVDCSNSGTTWEPLDLGTPGPLATGANNGVIVAVESCPYKFIRTRFVNASGTGSLNCIVSAKQVG